MGAAPHPPRFNQDRKDWATGVDPITEYCYKGHFDITDHDICEVENLVNDKHDRKDGYESHQILDYGGTDKILHLGKHAIHVAERVRPNNKDCLDMSLRVENGVEGRDEEVVKWATAIKKHGFYPRLLSFGIYDSVIDVLKEFYLIDGETLINALANGSKLGEVNPNTEDDTEALYIPVDKLRDIGAVLAEWTDITKAQVKSATPKKQSPQPSSPVALSQSTDGEEYWPSDVNDLAAQCYQDRYAVKQRNIHDISSLIDTVHNEGEGKRTCASLKSCGLDQIIDCGDRHIHVHEQWKSSRKDRRGLELCTETGTDGGIAELAMWLEAYRNRGYFPTVIALGVYEEFLNGFTEFHLVHIEQILAALDSGKNLGVVRTDGNGAKTRHITINELREIGAVIDSWDGVRSKASSSTSTVIP